MDSSTQEPVTLRKTRKDARKERTRQRLIDATVDIVRTEGVAGLTTGKIAKGAGIQQPGFYAHFKNVEDCLRVAAEQIANHIVQADARLRRAAAQSSDDQNQLEQATTRMKLAVRHWVIDNRRFAELFARCRYDATPIGDVCRETAHRARAAVMEDMWTLATSYGLRESYRKDVELMSALLVATFTGGVDLILSGQVSDPDAVATALAHNQRHYVRAELVRLIAEQSAHSTEVR